MASAETTLEKKEFIAYFSMEVALDPGIPTYAGGLGVLAGDTLRSAAELGLPMAGVTLLHRKGYFRQRLDERGLQTEEPERWNPESLLEPMTPLAEVHIEGRPVKVKAWRYELLGEHGRRNPVYFLDTGLPENDPVDQALTDSLYGGEGRYRLAQEAVLGMGGVEMLRLLGHNRISSFHMNEGHSALLTLALMERQLGSAAARVPTEEDAEAVRRQCVFTTHTPVPAGHDKYPWDLAGQVLGNDRRELLSRTGCCSENMLNLTYLALRFSRYVNGVAMSHGELSQDMYPNYPIRSITNGVHAQRWVSPPFQELFDRNIPEWRKDNRYLRYAVGIPLEEIREAHSRAKRVLIDKIRQAHGVTLKPDVLTIGFARRATAYKRADLLFTNLQRLRWIARNVGPIQLIFGGKAHRQDQPGKSLIRHLAEIAQQLKDSIPMVYVENYDLNWAQLLVSGADLWLNTPQRPMEASGTSGMKAVLNGVPSLSVLDGWWVEGHVEGKTGWSIGRGGESEETSVLEAASLYDKLEEVILPIYYGQPRGYAAIMRHTIALNGSFFNTQRMLRQYVLNAYSHPEAVFL